MSAINFAICEEDIATVMRYPWTSIGSDGSGTDPHGPASKDIIHPRTYGTFTRILGRYVREKGILGAWRGDIQDDRPSRRPYGFGGSRQNRSWLSCRYYNLLC